MTEKKYDPFFDLICYMATSARGCVDEPKLYGPFRLVDSIERLINIMEESGRANDFYLRIREKIEKEKYSVMNDKEKFVSFLDEIVDQLAEKTTKK